MSKTKIVATLGPSLSGEGLVRKAVEAGADVFRINTAHGTIEEYQELIRQVRVATPDVAVLVDIKGPEIRIKTKNERPVNKGDLIEVGFSEEFSDRFTHDFFSDVSIGDRVLIKEGLIETVVAKLGEKSLILEVKNETEVLLENSKSVTVPGKHLNIPPLSEKDLECVKMSNELGVEFIALSFVRNQEDVENLRKITKCDIISKIENREGVENLDEILAASDGIMVARGDLGVELPLEEVPLVQKKIIDRCNEAGKPVITATHMLESMIGNLRPTRAEVSDVANAVFDFTDAVMLSGETAKGKYPLEAIRIMDRICKYAEKYRRHRELKVSAGSIADAVSKALGDIADCLKIDKIIIPTTSGYTARAIARLHLETPIISLTSSKSVRNKLRLSYGVFPIYVENLTAENEIPTSILACFEKGLVKETDLVCVVLGICSGHKTRGSNTISVQKVGDVRACKF